MVSSLQRVGVDIELVTPKIDNIRDKFLNPEEQLMIANIDSLQFNLLPAALLTAAWSIKESLFKWYGDGQVDFKKHLHINRIMLTSTRGIAACTFLKNKPVNLDVHFLFLNDNCLAWVVS